MWKAFLALFFLFTSVTYGATEKLTFKKGWNLAGSFLSFSLGEFSNVTSIKTVWLWNGNGWKVWSPDKKILNLITFYGLPLAKEVEQGEGFWINSNEDGEVSVCGTASYNFTFNLPGKGWYLLSPPVEKEIKVKTLFSSDSVVSLWKWESGSWKVWSPSKEIMELVKNYGLSSFDFVKPSEGFWINLKDSLKLSFSSKGNEKTYLNFLILEDKTLLPVSSAVVKKPDGKKLLLSGWSLKLPLESGIYTFYRDGFENCTVHYTKTDKIGDCFVAKDKTIVVFLRKSEEKLPFPMPYLNDGELLLSFQNLISPEAIAPKPIAASSALTKEEGSIVVKNMNPQEDYTVSVILMPGNSIEWNGKGKPLYYFAVNIEDPNGNFVEEAKGEFEAKPIVHLNGVKLNFNYFYLYEKAEDGWHPVCKVDLINDTLKPSSYASELSDFLIVGYTDNDTLNFSCKVVDEYGNPVKNAVVVSDSKVVFSANEKGEISAVLPPSTSKLLIFSPGYQLVELTPPYPQVIKLKKLEKEISPYELSFYYKFPSPVYADVSEKGKVIYFFTFQGTVYSLTGNEIEKEFQLPNGYVYKSVTSTENGFTGALLNFDGTVFHYDASKKELYSANLSDVLFDSYYSYYPPISCSNVIYFTLVEQNGKGYVLPTKFSNGNFLFYSPVELEEEEMIDGGACLGNSLIAGTFNWKTGSGRILKVEPSGEISLDINAEGIKAEPLLLPDGSTVFGSCNGTIYRVANNQILTKKNLGNFCIYRLSLLDSNSIALSTSKGVIILDSALDEIQDIPTSSPVTGKVFSYGDTFVFSSIDGTVYVGDKPIARLERKVVGYNLISGNVLLIQATGGEVLGLKLPEWGEQW